MKLKTFLYVLLGFLAFFGIVALFYANRLLLGERFFTRAEGRSGFTLSLCHPANVRTRVLEDQWSRDR